MSIFKSILAKIFPPNHPATADATEAPAASAGAPATPNGPPAAATAGATTPPATAGESPAAPPVDVNAVLSELQSKHSEKLNWKTSIVDLLKLLGLDSSLTARKQLASELHYTGSTEDSAAMNIWLHKAVVQKLRENGGKLPDDMKG